MATLNFNATQVAPQAAMDPIPPGWYKMAIIESEIVPTKSDPVNGRRLNLVFQVLEGQYQGRKVYEGLNIMNANPKAQEIAQSQLSAIAHATNVLMVQDSSQLHNIPLNVKVKIKPAEGQYEPKNEVSGYKNANEIVGSAAPGAAPAAPAFVPPPVPAAAAPVAAQPWTPPAAAQFAAPAPAVAAPVAPVAVAPAAAPAGGIVPPWAAAPATA